MLLFLFSHLLQMRPHWHLHHYQPQRFQRNLTEAFRLHDSRLILRLSAEIGHYIGDAHVPLHTCSNYNGQKTNQHGIHGFWESRIPELFADENYDYFVGKPEYIANTTEWFWNTVFDSHSMVDSVLSIELALRQTFPADRQMCPDMRLGRAVVAPCREFSAAYSAALNNMVERRMRAAIHAVSSAWYTAWVDAGLAGRTFVIDGAGSTDPDFPSVRFLGPHFGLGAELALPAHLALAARAGTSLWTTGGELSSSAWFPAAQSWGLDAGLRLRWALPRGFAPYVDLGWSRDIVALHPQVGAARVAGGAADDRFAAKLGLEWTLGPPPRPFAPSASARASRRW